MFALNKQNVPDRTTDKDYERTRLFKNLMKIKVTYKPSFMRSTSPDLKTKTLQRCAPEYMYIYIFVFFKSMVKKNVGAKERGHTNNQQCLRLKI